MSLLDSQVCPAPLFEQSPLCVGCTLAPPKEASAPRASLRVSGCTEPSRSLKAGISSRRYVKPRLCGLGLHANPAAYAECALAIA